jgi:hypothetical protein
MIFHRIEPIQHETFYVLADEDAYLDAIASSPVCFSPVSYRQEVVDPGEIPAHAKIVFFDAHDRSIKRVNLETAIKLSMNQPMNEAEEIGVAIETLKMAMQKNGLSAPVSIELQDADQVAKLAALLSANKVTLTSRNLTDAIKHECDKFLFGGMEFNWLRQSVD